jgi:hypothetical protein
MFVTADDFEMNIEQTVRLFDEKYVSPNAKLKGDRYQNELLSNYIHGVRRQYYRRMVNIKHEMLAPLLTLAQSDASSNRSKEQEGCKMEDFVKEMLGSYPSAQAFEDDLPNVVKSFYDRYLSAEKKLRLQTAANKRQVTDQLLDWVQGCRMQWYKRVVSVTKLSLAYLLSRCRRQSNGFTRTVSESEVLARMEPCTRMAEYEPQTRRPLSNGDNGKNSKAAVDIEEELDWDSFDFFACEEDTISVASDNLGAAGNQLLFENPRRIAPHSAQVESIHSERNIEGMAFGAPNSPYMMDNWMQLREQHFMNTQAHWTVHVDSEVEWWMQCVCYVSHQIVFECFRDHEPDFTKKNLVSISTIRSFLQWWIEESASLLVREMITRWRNGEVVNASFYVGLKERLLGIGVRTVRQLYEGHCKSVSRPVCERDAAIGNLQDLAASIQSRQSLIQDAIRDLLSITNEQFVDIFNQKHKQLDIFLQAAITAIMYVRGDAYTLGLQFATQDSFQSVVTATEFEQDHMKYCRLPGFNNCHDSEIRHLWFNYNMMVITNQIVQRGNNKQRFMEIASRLVEKRLHKTGGGNCGEARRREVLYELISGLGFDFTVFWLLSVTHVAFAGTSIYRRSVLAAAVFDPDSEACGSEKSKTSSTPAPTFIYVTETSRSSAQLYPLTRHKGSCKNLTENSQLAHENISTIPSLWSRKRPRASVPLLRTTVPQSVAARFAISPSPNVISLDNVVEQIKENIHRQDSHAKVHVHQVDIPIASIAVDVSFRSISGENAPLNANLNVSLQGATATIHGSLIAQCASILLDGQTLSTSVALYKHCMSDATNVTPVFKTTRQESIDDHEHLAGRSETCRNESSTDEHDDSECANCSRVSSSTSEYAGWSGRLFETEFTHSQYCPMYPAPSSSVFNYDFDHPHDVSRLSCPSSIMDIIESTALHQLATIPSVLDVEEGLSTCSVFQHKRSKRSPPVASPGLCTIPDATRSSSGRTTSAAVSRVCNCQIGPAYRSLHSGCGSGSLLAGCCAQRFSQGPPASDVSSFSATEPSPRGGGNEEDRYQCNFVAIPSSEMSLEPLITVAHGCSQGQDICSDASQPDSAISASDLSTELTFVDECHGQYCTSVPTSGYSSVLEFDSDNIPLNVAYPTAGLQTRISRHQSIDGSKQVVITNEAFFHPLFDDDAMSLSPSSTVCQTQLVQETAAAMLEILKCNYSEFHRFWEVKELVKALQNSITSNNPRPATSTGLTNRVMSETCFLDLTLQL